MRTKNTDWIGGNVAMILEAWRMSDTDDIHWRIEGEMKHKEGLCSIRWAKYMQPNYVLYTQSGPPGMGRDRNQYHNSITVDFYALQALAQRSWIQTVWARLKYVIKLCGTWISSIQCTLALSVLSGCLTRRQMVIITPPPSARVSKETPDGLKLCKGSYILY